MEYKTPPVTTISPNPSENASSEVLRSCTLTLYSAPNKVLHTVDVEISEHPTAVNLSALYRDHLAGTHCRYAVAREETAAHALFLPKVAVPDSAVRFAGQRRSPGRWITSILRLGTWGGGRAFLGPEIFFRQVDLEINEAWLAPALVGFAADVQVREISAGDGSLYLWTMASNHFAYDQSGAQWRLYSAGNTPWERVEQVMAEEKPDTVSDLLWSIGAVRIHP